MSLRRALTADLPLKFTSLVLALLLWFLAASGEPASAFREVELVVRPPDGRRVIRPPQPVRALVVGPRRELLKLSTAPMRLSRVIPDTLAADEVRLDLAPGEVELPRGVDVHVQDLQPRTVQIRLDSTVQRVVPVAPVVHLQADSGFVLAGVSVVPGMVRLLGPRERVAELDSVRTEPLEVFGAQAPVIRELGLDTAGFGPVRVIPRAVTTRVDVEPVSERVLAGLPVRLASASAAGVRPEPDSVRVTVRGRAGRLASLEPEQVVVVADWAGAAPPARAALRVLAPHGMTGRAEPDSVDLVPRRSGG